MKLTNAQERALRGLRDRDNIAAHFHGLAERGGLEGSTIPALLRKGLLSYDEKFGYQLTESGREAVGGRVR